MIGGGQGSQEQDGDRDGISDSSDKCAHSSNPRCFKEGGDTNSTTTTTTSTQQQSSLISRKILFASYLSAADLIIKGGGH